MHRNVSRGQVRFNLTNNLTTLSADIFSNALQCQRQPSDTDNVFVYFSNSSRRVYLMKPVKNVII